MPALVQAAGGSCLPECVLPLFEIGSSERQRRKTLLEHVGVFGEDELSCIHKKDAVGKGLEARRDVQRDEDGGIRSLGKMLAQDRERLVAYDGVELCGWLVEEQERGSRGEGERIWSFMPCPRERLFAVMPERALTFCASSNLSSSSSR